MSVFRQKDRKHFTYKFDHRGKTYKGSTGCDTEDAALAYEAAERARVVGATGGDRRTETDLRNAPAFATWAGVYYAYKATSKHKVKRPDAIDFMVRTMLKFFGRAPSDPAKVDPYAPYHDLTLADPIREPDWLDQFETWMTAQGFSGSHCNHLRTQVSGCYRVAMLPKHRLITGITMNPMDGVPRDRRKKRTATITAAQLRAWMGHAAYHVRLAMAIAALAPKLRRSNVLALEWGVHLDRGLTKIVVADHKTDAHGEPLVVLVDPQLRAILTDARKRNLGRFVVSYRGRRVKDVRGGVKLAAERAGISYGVRSADGVTFHTIRHAVASWFAEMPGVTEPQRMALMGHSDQQTTQGYTHLHPASEQAPLAALAASLQLVDVVIGARTQKRDRLQLVRRDRNGTGDETVSPEMLNKTAEG